MELSYICITISLFGELKDRYTFLDVDAKEKKTMFNNNSFLFIIGKIKFYRLQNSIVQFFCLRVVWPHRNRIIYKKKTTLVEDLARRAKWIT